MVTPPEVVLDRWVRTQAKRCGCGGYVGKLDIETVDSPSFRSFLLFVQEAINGALLLENVNASGGVEHPPFHFDYIQVDDGSKNAHAFQHEGFAFIVATLPLIELLWDLSLRLSRSQQVLRLLQIDPAVVRQDALQGLLFTAQIGFLVSHEYTHHIHRHVDEDERRIIGAWTEFLQGDAGGSMDLQAQELDADGYAVYLGLANLVRGAARQGALDQLGRQDLQAADADGLLLMCFFLALTAFFCSIWRENIDMTSIEEFRHPPAPVRIEYAIRIAKMWCGQNGSVPQAWFDTDRFRALFHTAAEAIGANTRRAWDAHILFLLSREGAEYDARLSERFQAMRVKRD